MQFNEANTRGHNNNATPPPTPTPPGETMSIHVHTEHDTSRYNDGVKWYIDEAEMLHVIDKDGKHIAAYSRGQWASVERKTAAAQQVTINQSIGFTDSAGDAALKTARALKLSNL